MIAQIGQAEDEEKPEFAGLRQGQKMETITLEEALELIMEELSYQEDPYSAGDILRLLQLEPFWRWAWDPWPDPEALRPQRLEPIAATGTTLPLGLRPLLVDTVHRMEVELLARHPA